MDEKPRAKTKEEVRSEFLKHLRNMAQFWAGIPDKSNIDRCMGVAFSILSSGIDGDGDLPHINLVLDPHPEDKDFLKSEGMNWYKKGMVINDDGPLHEQFFH